MDVYQTIPTNSTEICRSMTMAMGGQKWNGTSHAIINNAMYTFAQLALYHVLTELDLRPLPVLLASSSGLLRGELFQWPTTEVSCSSANRLLNATGT